MHLWYDSGWEEESKAMAIEKKKTTAGATHVYPSQVDAFYLRILYEFACALSMSL